MHSLDSFIHTLTSVYTHVCSCIHVFIHYGNLINLNFCVFKLAAAGHELFLRLLQVRSWQPFLLVVCARIIKMSLITAAHIYAQQLFTMLLCSCVCQIYLIFLWHKHTGCQTCHSRQQHRVVAVAGAFTFFSAANATATATVTVYICIY